MEEYEKMDKYLKSSITAKSAENGKMTLFEKEKVIGIGGTGIVATYRSTSGERVVVKVSYCNQPKARETGTREMQTALDASDISFQKHIVSSQGFFHSVVIADTRQTTYFDAHLVIPMKRLASMLSFHMLSPI